MEGGPLLSDWWVEDTKNYVLYLNVMSKVDTHPDQEMLRHYKLRGFPSFLLIDSEGKKIDDFRPSSREALKSAGEFASLKMSGAADSKDLNVRAKFLMLSLMKEPSEEGAAKLAETMKADEVTPELKKEYEAWKPKYEMVAFLGGFMGKYQEVGRDPEAVAELEKEYGTKALALWAKGARPDSSDMQASYVFGKLLMEASVAAKNKKSGEGAMEILNKAFSTNKRAAKMLEEMKGLLDSIE